LQTAELPTIKNIGTAHFWLQQRAFRLNLFLKAIATLYQQKSRKMELKNSKIRLVITLIMSMFSAFSVAQTTGSFKGKIIEQATKQPIIGASVLIDTTQLGTVSDTAGIFTLNNIPIGIYSATISYIYRISNKKYS
jgi:CarboxypepD_reg-like domain